MGQGEHPEHPHGSPPGQTREPGEHPLGGAPGQQDKPDKPGEPEDVDPDAPHPDQTLPGDVPPVEPDEGDDPDKAPA